MGGRFVMLWSGGSLHPFADFIRNRSLWFRYVLAFNLCAAFRGARGDCWRSSGSTVSMLSPLAIGPVLFPFAYYLTVAEPRYRHAIDPALMLLLAVTLAELAPQARPASPEPSAALPRRS